MRTFVRVAAALALVAYTAAIVFGNPATVPVDLVFVALEAVPLWLVLGIALLLGIAITALLMSIPLLRMSLRLRRQARQLGALEQEVHGLRTLPIDSDEGASEVASAGRARGS